MFNKALEEEWYKKWVHFYIHDDRFEKIWKTPKDYLERLKKYAGIITPDFSVYIGMPYVMQTWNTYRNRTIGYCLQNNGIKIIPNVRWGDERTYDFAFEGLEKGGNFAVSTNGCLQDKFNREYFAKGGDGNE